MVMTQQIQQNRAVVRHRISGISALLAMILFPTAYWICDFFYPSMEEIDSWRFMRDLLYSLEAMLLIISCNFPKNKLTIASIWGLSVLVFGDVVDRVFFKTYSFDWSDWPLLITAATVFAYKLNIKNELFSSRRTSK